MAPMRLETGCFKELGRLTLLSYTARIYRHTASGAHTTRMPTHQAILCSTEVAVGPPSVRARTAVATIETGCRVANSCSQLGIELTGTKADEANTSGAMIGNAAAWALSGSAITSPMAANTHERA